MNRVTNIIVKFDIEGFHCWPDAPEQFKLLKERHGHVFHFECSIPVTKSRQIEFLEARRVLLSELKASYQTSAHSELCDFRGMSCEDLCSSIARTCVNVFNTSPARVAVYEDVFVGAEVLHDRQ